jgi:hypothetical protein
MLVDLEKKNTDLFDHHFDNGLLLHLGLVQGARDFLHLY